jgi:hypothetical protein
VEYSLLDLQLFLEELEERAESQPVIQGPLVASSQERFYTRSLDGPLRTKSGWA